jgi:hypothetical protein
MIHDPKSHSADTVRRAFSGNLAIARFHSLHLALRAFYHPGDFVTSVLKRFTEIKAIEEGLLEA